MKRQILIKKITLSVVFLKDTEVTMTYIKIPPLAKNSLSQDITK